MTLLLKTLIDRYVEFRNDELEIGRELSPQTHKYYLEVVQCFGVYLGHTPTLEDLTPELVNKFLTALLSDGRSRHTVRNRRTGFHALMRHAKREGLTTADPDRLRRVNCPPLNNKGYSVSDMERLLAYSAQLTGRQRRSGVSKRTYWVSMILLMWNIGCRIGDVLTIQRSKFDPSGRLWVYESKTRKSGWHRLHRSTAEAIAICLTENPVRETIWPGFTRRNVSRAFSDLAVAAGVGGTSRFIRRGSSSALDKLEPGMGWRFLKHSSPTVFEQHYRDSSICGDESLAPPQLSCSDDVVGMCRPMPRPERRPSIVKRSERAVVAPRDLPMTDAVRAAMLSNPPDIGTVDQWLREHGIRPRQIAEWWGYQTKSYRNFLCGAKSISLESANRLRDLFGLPAIRDESTPYKPDTIKSRSLPAPPTLLATLGATSLGAYELRKVIHYIRDELGFAPTMVALTIGINFDRLNEMLRGRRAVAPQVIAELRMLFSETGYVE